MLSKSDFKIASSCGKKLIYKKAGYATRNDGNEYMEMLAQGGHLVSKYAQLMFPDGIEIKSKTIEEAIAETSNLISTNTDVVLFEATFLSGSKIVRVDILEKKGNVLHLIEVKSSSFDSTDVKSKSNLSQHFSDVAFQTKVLSEVHPDLTIKSFLYVPDKSKRTTLNGLAGWFRVNDAIQDTFENDELPAQAIPKFTKPEVEFVYEFHPERDSYLEQLRRDCLLTLVSIDDEVREVMPIVESQINFFLDILENGLRPDEIRLTKNCKYCEYKLGKETDRNGYRECFGSMSDQEPHIFDLYFGGSLGHAKTGWYLDELLDKGKVSLWDIDTERLKGSKGALGSRGERQMLQMTHTKSNTEWISPELRTELDSLVYPLHFIDFETYLGAIPHNAGQRPYEIAAFQWSCHTIERPGTEAVHSEFLNTEYDFPNFRFAESLMKQIGTSGTPLMWSQFENTILRMILDQMGTFKYRNDELRDWLIGITTDKAEGRVGRFVDMNQWVMKHYFHPEMKGKTSIKKVLPAIWNNNPYLHSMDAFKKYAPVSDRSLNPYDSLSTFIEELEDEEVVADGTGAMRAYSEIMFGSAKDSPERRTKIQQLLLNYCELDTAAMVIIWKYFMDKSLK